VYLLGVPRPRLGSTAHTVAVTVKLSAREVEALDRLRAGRSRSGYLRRLLVAARDKAPNMYYMYYMYYIWSNNKG
jgi:hypothetical protein